MVSSGMTWVFWGLGFCLEMVVGWVVIVLLRNSTVEYGLFSWIPEGGGVEVLLVEERIVYLGG